MNNKIGLILWVAAVVSPWLALRAGEPAARAVTGHVLILDNERTLEGDVERDGDRYRVRRSVGQTWVPAEKVLKVCADWKEAYGFLSASANLQDPDERVRLSRWCQEHGLREQALAEARAALELQPDSVEGRRLLLSLRQVAPDPVRQAAPAAEHGPATPPVDLDLESLGQFAVRVQPILMNTCATCHSSGRGGSFKLMRAYDAGVTSRRATQQNLTAVLGQVNRQKWQASPLLTRAVSVHGEATQPPLKGKQTPAYRTIEEWVKTTLAKNPLPEEPGPVASAAASVPERREPAEATSPMPMPTSEKIPFEPAAGEKPAGEQWASGRHEDPQVHSVGASNKDCAAPSVQGKQGTAAPPPPQPAGPVDEFDPVLFNGQGQAAQANEGPGPGR